MGIQCAALNGNKYNRSVEISKWFSSDADGRSIRGYINSIDKKPEDKARYKSYLHKEEVKKVESGNEVGVKTHQFPSSIKKGFRVYKIKG